MAVIDRDRWRVLEPLLDEALELSAEQRAGWLGDLRTRSPDVAADLAALLSGEVTAERRGFLAEPMVPPLEGLQLGAYALERPLGHGGMGSVWLARRTDGRFEGKAAVKLLDLGALSATGQERFRREGSMVARLAHPGIARLLDAGVASSGQPYLVLEYVEGARIDVYADERRLTLEQRVRLVFQVLATVGHAHAKLVVHRDLKPSNILVTADGTAKLLDFGIAKLLAPDGSEERTAITDVGSRALTPKYAAPEQVRGDAVTTATDVYALGVLLYVLLTGRHPYDLGGGASASEIERIVCEAEPPRPSATFEGNVTDQDDRAARARARGSTPERLRRQLRGDLDVIVLKALRKEAERRYESAAAMADDLRRFLDGRPVLARPDGTAYRVRKFVGRHRGGLAVAAAGVLLLAGAAVRERTLRARAEAQASKATAVEEYLVSVFDASDPFAPNPRQGEEVTARALLDRGAVRVDSLTDQPEVQAELRGALGRVYTSLGLYDRAAPLLRRSLEQKRTLHGESSAAVAEAMDRLGVVLMSQGRLDEAERLLREALAQRRRILGNRSAATAETLDHLGELLRERSDFGAAEPLYREALAIQRALHGPDHGDVANSINNLALLLVYRGEYDHAEPLYREALAIRERTLGENHPVTADVLANLAQAQWLRGRFVESETLFRRALAVNRKTLGNAHPSVTGMLNNLTSLLSRDLERPQEAEPLAREALALDRQMFGEQDAHTAESLNDLGSALRLKGDLDEAERSYRQSLAVNRSLYGAENIRIANNLNNVGTTLFLKGRVDEAIPLFRESRAQYGRLHGEKHRNFAVVSTNLARALRERGRLAEAESLLRVASSRLDPAKPGLRTPYIAAQIGLGEVLTGDGRAAEALPLLERALEMSRQKWKADSWHVGEARLVLGECLAASGQYAAAEPHLREAYSVLERHRRAQPRLFARAGTAIGRVRQASSRTGTR